MTAPPADRRIRRYVRRTVYPYSSHYHALLDGVGVGRRVKGRADLARIPPTDLGAVAEPGALVLRPDLRLILRHGHTGLAAWGAAARVSGGMHRFSRHVERRFKPILWVLADGVPLGYSAADVSLLGRRGEAWLRRAGVSRGDVVLSLLPSGPSVAYWQLTLGLRRAGVSSIHLEPGHDVAALARLAPTVLVGEPGHLLDVLSAARAGGYTIGPIRTVLAVGAPLSSDRRTRLAELAGGASVVAAWAPHGVRAVWSECRAGAAQPVPTGYHVWDDDLLEIAGRGESGAAEGEVLWTGLGWGGSALLRLRTFAVAGLLSHACPACGQRGMLVVPHAPVPRREAAGPVSAPATTAEGPPEAPAAQVPVAAATVATPPPAAPPAPEAAPPAPPPTSYPPGSYPPGPPPGSYPPGPPPTSYPPGPPPGWYPPGAPPTSYPPGPPPGSYPPGYPSGPPPGSPPGWGAPPPWAIPPGAQPTAPPTWPAPPPWSAPPTPAPVPPVPVPSGPVPIGEVFDAEPEVASWLVEYRIVDGAPETIVTFAPAWGAAVVPLIRRLDRHLRATQFVVVSVDEVTARITAVGGRIVGTAPA